MRRLAAGTRLVVASHNQGKLREIDELVRPFGLNFVSAASLNLAAPPETGRTFADNARIKALAAAHASGLPALADDSGLEVDALDGAPGVCSARWAGPETDFALAMRKVADAVTARGGWAAPGPRANFTCALCLAWADGEAQVFEGRVLGSLVWPSRGTRGFGYDPMFLPDGETLTFGEMDPAHKNAISHRARAFALFVANCLDAGAR
ncbi:MAG TPA: RdgB/HAM1 family non-canonical purine NTP pyrophosphatase [Hyphomicrobiaceae bacterium]|nr:RdgB/HAM1 family non-canonical purine NTP pyrophosphatase [Hyphomicrobiaceae bacterium]